MRARRSAQNWYSKISIHITGQSAEIKRHQTPTKNKSTEMLRMVNAVVGSETWTLTSDLMDETAGSNRDVNLTQNVKDILQRQGDK